MLVASAALARRMAVAVNIPPRVAAGIVFALPVEAGRFADRVEEPRRIEATGVVLHAGLIAGRTVAWVVGGTGVARAGRACRLLIDGHRPGVVIAAGFAGGLAQDLERGTAVSPRRVARPGHETIDLAAAQGIVTPRPLTLVTVERVVCAVKEKERLRNDSAADLVDLETWAVAEQARGSGIPCLCMRVISDAASDELPAEVARLTEATSPWRRLGTALRTLGSRPAAALDLWQLWERAVLDSRTLADALEREVSRLGRPSTPP